NMDLKVIKDLRAIKGLKVTKDLKVIKDLKGLKAKLAHLGRNDLHLQQISSANMNWLSGASLGSLFF
ncbi:hypothetical protein, partial [Paenibacillus larvae]|uniref:hypothetical protein n=1 Tax=Paenibacillus larvae TaxID=1464 RepID=UPI0022830A61